MHCCILPFSMQDTNKPSIRILFHSNIEKKKLKKGKEDYETNTMLIKIKLIFLKIPLLWLNLKKTPKNPKPICNNFVQSEVSSAQCRG